MEPNMAPRRLWHVVRAVLFMLRKSMSKRKKLSMDLQLLLHRSKIAGKALSKLITAHGHHDDQPASQKAPPPPFSCRALDPALAVYNNPRGAGHEVEFSCSNTPSYRPIQLIPTKRGRRRNNNRRTHRGANGAEPGWYNYDAADIAKVFEVLNDEQLIKDVVGDGDSTPLAVLATPSPALWSSFGRSPAPVRQLRITDSPFPLRDDDAADQDGGLVDLEADEFIRKFYDQLRTQQSLAVATPEYGYARPATGVAY